MRVGSLEISEPEAEVPEPSVPNISVTSCRRSGYGCREALTESYCWVNAADSVVNWASKFVMEVVKSGLLRLVLRHVHV